MDEQIKKRIIKIAVAVVGLTIAAVIAYFVYDWYKHGACRINTDKTITKIEVYKKPELTMTEFKDGKHTVKLEAGEYVVKTYFEGNQSYSKEVTIGNWGKRIDVMPIYESKEYTKLLGSTLSQFCHLKQNDYVSYGRGYTAQVYAMPSVIRGFNPKNITDCHHDVDGNIMLAANNNNNKIGYYYYDTERMQNITIGEQQVASSVDLYHADDGFYTLSERILHTVTRDGMSNVNIPSSINYSINSGTPIISKNKTHIAFLNGNNYDMQGMEFYEELEPDGGTAALNDVSVDIFTLSNIADGIQPTTVKLDKVADISQISLSPSSKHLAVVRDNTIAIYDVSTRELVMTTVASATLNGLVWEGDDSLVFLDSDLFIEKADIKNVQTFTILAQNELTISSISDYEDGVLYFTGFSATSDEVQYLPTGYSVRLR